jgi:uncharacterized protein (DUF305 family)
VRAAAAAFAAVALVGCGGAERVQRPAAPASSPDDAFVVRFYSHQQTGAELIRAVAPRVRPKRLVTAMQELRADTLQRLEPFRERAGSPEALGNLGVSRDQAAEDVTPTALDGVRPLTPAFLATMVRHDQGAVALLRGQLERGRDPGLKAFARELLGLYTQELDRLNRAIAQQTA